ncbi:MAG: hypothetical protein JWM99_3792 [Verrucomicrobiales bacterium]|nr:hypothetical protein [Verrucomicrobiales bacterium]
MKRLKILTAAALIATFAFGPASTLAADKKSEKNDKANSGKAYPLKTCVVSDEKLGGDMGEPYVFSHKGQEIKLCCKSCKKDFDKDPAKYLKKLDAAENKTK